MNKSFGDITASHLRSCGPPEECWISRFSSPSKWNVVEVLSVSLTPPVIKQLLASNSFDLGLLSAVLLLSFSRSIKSQRLWHLLGAFMDTWSFLCDLSHSVHWSALRLLTSGRSLVFMLCHFCWLDTNLLLAPNGCCSGCRAVIDMQHNTIKHLLPFPLVSGHGCLSAHIKLLQPSAGVLLLGPRGGTWLGSSQPVSSWTG